MWAVIQIQFSQKDNEIMEFNSPIFLFLFLPVFMFTYHLTDHWGKKIVGIIGSLLFYAWGSVTYSLLLLILLFFSYLIGMGIKRASGQKLSGLIFGVGVTLTIALLIGFKMNSIVRYPLGLSYISFQIVAYYYEVYTNKVNSVENLLDFSYYLLMFPKIPVGPITRYSQLKNQFLDIKVESDSLAKGLRRFIIGFAKKALIADTLSRIVTPIFSLSSPTITPSTAWLVIIAYSLQLYFDFSGYTDMAIGLGQMMGFRFMENFNFPYLSKSIGEFWRRWHISLSSWFRDIVFYPLERRRLKWIGQPVNILIVFVLTGLWHGLAANFVIWGMIHGLALILESTALGKRLRKMWTPLQHAYALGIIVIGWVFFRSPTPHFALVFLRRMAGDFRGLKPLPFEMTSPLPFIEPTFVFALFLGVLFSLPIGQMVSQFIDRIPDERYLLKISIQIIGDFALIFAFFLSVAATANTKFVPSIYGSF